MSVNRKVTSPSGGLTPSFGRSKLVAPDRHLWNTRMSVRAGLQSWAPLHRQGESDVITNLSGSLEIGDLQRMLADAKLLSPTASFQTGVWGEETQRAVLAAYRELGWDHDLFGQWISVPALAVLAGRLRAGAAGQGKPGSTGGAGNHAGGPGNHAGGPGNHAGGAVDIT